MGRLAVTQATVKNHQFTLAGKKSQRNKYIFDGCNQSYTVLAYAISIIVGHLMPNPFNTYILDIYI